MTNLVGVSKQGTPETMSSREIAELTGKEHRKVTRDIEVMLGQVEKDPAKFGHIYFDAYNREQREFLLPKNLTLTLVTGYRADLRLKVINRWMELEAAKDQLPELKDPALAAIMATLTQLDAMKQEQQAQSTKLTAIEHNLNYFDGYYTVQGYCSLLGEPVDHKTAKQIGFKAAKACRAKEIEPHKVSHPIYGQVNSYPEHILEEVV